MKCRDIIRTLERSGFQLLRVSGSHRIYQGPDGRRIIVGWHITDNLTKGNVNKLAKQTGIPLAGWQG